MNPEGVPVFTDDVRRLALSVLAVLALSACADDTAPADTDAGDETDVTADGESDAPEFDADEDTAADAGEDATIDGGSDSGSDDTTEDTTVEDTTTDVADVAEDTTTDVSVDDTDVSVEDTSDDVGDVGDVGDDVADVAEPDTETDSGSTGCIAPGPGDLVINEVLPSPATGNAGDANCDGTRNAVDDEFIEIVNVSDGCVELAGVGVETGSDGLQYTFGLDTGLQPGHAIVLFGGGAPVFDGTSTQALTHCVPLTNCDVLIQTTFPGALGLAPEDSVALRYDSTVLDSVEWGGTGVTLIAGESLTRSPELTGDFVTHTTVAAGVTMSPGTAATGTEWGICVD
jgi:hypothetical protein